MGYRNAFVELSARDSALPSGTIASDRLGEPSCRINEQGSAFDEHTVLDVRLLFFFFFSVLLVFNTTLY